MIETPKFLTTRETAKTGIISEHYLRLKQKQGKLPCIMCGNKCMVNYTLLREMLNNESKKTVIGYDNQGG